MQGIGREASCIVNPPEFIFFKGPLFCFSHNGQSVGQLIGRYMSRRNEYQCDQLIELVRLR